MLEKNEVISEELVLDELQLLINEWVEKPEPREKLKETYPSIFEGLANGRVVIDADKVPTYTLAMPIKNDKGDISLSNLNFKTRISPINQARLGKGMSIATDQLMFALVCIAYIVEQPTAMLDKFSKKDYNLVRELASLFM